MYPYCVYSAFVHAYYTKTGITDFNFNLESFTVPDKSMLVCLCILALLQFFWFYLILVVLVRVLMGQKVDDERSDSEEKEKTE